MRDLHDLLIAGRMLGGNDSPELITKTVTANGTYSAAADNADGYSAVTVNVPEIPVTFLRSIKSTGNSIILTDISPAYDWAIHFNAKFENPRYGSGGNTFFGKALTTDHWGVGLEKWSASDRPNYLAYIGFAHSSGRTYYTSINENNLNIPNTFIARRGNGKCIAGFDSFTMTTIIEDTQTQTGAAICGVLNNQSVLVYDRHDLTIYGVKMFNGQNVLVHDLVPAQSKTTGRGGLYDIITGMFYPADSNYDDFVKEAIV